MRGGKVVGFIAGAVSPGGFYKRLLKRGWLAFALAAVPGVLRSPAAITRVLRALRKPGDSDPSSQIAGVFSFGVEPGLQGSGVGSQLLERAAAEAARAGCTSMRLETDAEDNDAVNDFYLSRGFRVARRYATPEGRRMLEYQMELSEKAMR
jgi:GNAT superfamily N-acetyltransferase